MRLLPKDAAVNLVRELVDSPDACARIVATEVIGRRSLAVCYPLLPELCLDADKEVTDVVRDAIDFLRLRPGVYGLDTVLLKSNNWWFCPERLTLERLIRRIIAGVA